MNTTDKNKVEQETEESKQQAMSDAKKNKETDDETIHTINPFTGAKTTITPEDLENVEKFNEAQTERD